MSKLKALIVDDSELSRQITGIIIKKIFAYDEAEDGLVAVEKYRQAIKLGAPYDIIFMDIIMPEMDGKKAVRQIREDEANNGLKRSPIIMVSASERIDDIENMVNGLLRKPASRALLNELLQDVFKGNIGLL
jgi:two-component system, chemotaxis family, chemotaxis protein CheY